MMDGWVNERQRETQVRHACLLDTMCLCVVVARERPELVPAS